MTTRGQHDLPLARLESWMREHIDGFRAPLAAEQFEGGQSNPTYRLRSGASSYVLRHKPLGQLLPSAHAVDREYRVMRALADTAVPVPKVYALCEDDAVIGSAFYVMEFLEGRIFWDPRLPDLPPAERRATFQSMNAVIAELHSIDYVAVGLAEFGRPGNYMARQVARWSRQYQASETEKQPAMDRLIEWLPCHLPPESEPRIVHGDYRIDNLIYHPTEPRVIGVLDWELSTLGHPLVDLAFNSQAWRMAPDENGGLLGLSLEDIGIPSERDYLEQYYECAGATERLTVFHQVFAMFRGAVGSAGVAARGDLGNNVLPDAANVGRRLAHAYATRGMELIEREP